MYVSEGGTERGKEGRKIIRKEGEDSKKKEEISEVREERKEVEKKRKIRKKAKKGRGRTHVRCVSV